jgi:hypothetical protein
MERFASTVCTMTCEFHFLGCSSKILVASYCRVGMLLAGEPDVNLHAPGVCYNSSLVAYGMCLVVRSPVFCCENIGACFCGPLAVERATLVIQQGSALQTVSGPIIGLIGPTEPRARNCVCLQRFEAVPTIARSDGRRELPWLTRPSFIDKFISEIRGTPHHYHDLTRPGRPTPPLSL